MIFLLVGTWIDAAYAHVPHSRQQEVFNSESGANRRVGGETLLDRGDQPAGCCCRTSLHYVASLTITYNNAIQFLAIPKTFHRTLRAAAATVVLFIGACS